MPSTVEADLAFTCPRCAAEVVGRFYGPCDTCRAALRTAYLSEARDVQAEEYVPKMNVTPNAVALKD
jgi:hypothetical protein